MSGSDTPSALLAPLRGQLRRWHPYAQMDDGALDDLLRRSEQRYLQPDEVLLAPDHGVACTLFLVRQGAVRAVAPDGSSVMHEAGALLPVSAALARRAVHSTYRAAGDLFVLAIAADAVQAIARRSPPLADFLAGEVQALLARSAQALREQQASAALAEQSLQTPLARLVRGQVLSCPPGTPLRTAIAAMHERAVGSILVMDGDAQALGILTRHDLPRIVLEPGFSLDSPVDAVMSGPVLALDEAQTAYDAALAMSMHAIRHVPVTRAGRVVGMVSERDLFALQRASLQQVGQRIRRAEALPALQVAAQEIRWLARQLLAQGVQARQLTGLVSHLNDLLTRRLVDLQAADAGVDVSMLCWLALGSEGRAEQTIATDQDNALVVPDATDDAQRERIRRWARGVNEALDACGYPLCRGGIMAGEPGGCLRLSQWRERFGHWIDHGSPQDLLQASIYFDLRPLAGDAALAQVLRADIRERARSTPRFIHQLAANALGQRLPLDLFGRLETADDGTLDLKLQGTALFVDAARVLALAQGVDATGTGARLVAATAQGTAPAREAQAWVGAFEYLQSLRLRAQLDAAATGQEPNRLAVAKLGEIDHRILVDAMRQARRLQQRVQMEWVR